MAASSRFIVLIFLLVRARISSFDELRFDELRACDSPLVVVIGSHRFGKSSLAVGWRNNSGAKWSHAFHAALSRLDIGTAKTGTERSGTEFLTT